jgi:outer membrane protein assembly factor BamB
LLQRQGLVPALVAGLALAPHARAADWPNFRGPNHNGISAETGLNASFGPGGPRRLWAANVGQGFSGIAVSGGRAYTLGNQGGQETVYCFNALNGQILWRHNYRCDPGDYEGPRATPSVDGNRVYTMSREGYAFSLDAASGRVLWQKDLSAESNAQAPRWGFAGSPLVEGNLVIFNVGTAGIALNKANGKTVWVSGPQMAGYSTPVPFTNGASRGVALFVAWGLVAVNPRDGKPLWQQRWETQFGVNAADPVISGDSAYISSGYNRGGALVKFGGGRARTAWENRNMRTHFNACVLVGQTLYGNDDGRLRALDLATGNERWSARGTMGKGGLLVADGKLWTITEGGELVVAQATPDRYAELGRAKVLDGTCWTQPALANGLLYVRSREGNLACLDLRGR